ncbi:inner membrane protein YhjD [Nocardia puris]|uniref:Membrane protein n=1 Tax=Nocardia puris TaxID=208602 RepID=A0A366D6K0_9NOCA|nr:inner membrane protein YhjD [Nocardia puris]MBF6212420.1 inner membrane protein YhjD [Nocardia puris]MBF6366667.1 inner membrane protein YhjD [Nocardia puris]MBF6461009.1 inner membrane protein YhjD [Nocardia puris]RBO85660.1 membrane protein [Nocardia puris]
MQVIDNIKAAVERRVQARPWLDHLVRAGGRYQSQRGDYYAAGITYFTVLSLFPLLMVAFAIAGFVLAGNPELFRELQDKIVELIPGEFGDQVNQLVDQAVSSRGTVGVLGLLGGLYTGLGWMANLRAALTEQWEQKTEDGNWFVTKLSDLGALLGLGVAFVVSFGLSAVGSSTLGARLLVSLGLSGMPGARVLLTVLSIVLAVIATWAVFAWIIARLPREPVTLASAAKAALLAAVAFEVFKYLASFYLQTVLRSPAGATFGSIIGLMVFSYITYRILLFATAWAATASDNLRAAEVEPPPPAVIQPRVVTQAASFGSAATYFGAGALAALGLGLFRRRH